MEDLGKPLMRLKEELHGTWRKEFTGSDDFAALYAATDYLTARGFSVGSTQRGAPTGIMLGSFEIAKWRNLSAPERAALHGVMNGDGRKGPITVTIFGAAPQLAHEAVRAPSLIPNQH